jgi:hypothetical protein
MVSKRLRPYVRRRELWPYRWAGVVAGVTAAAVIIGFSGAGHPQVSQFGLPLIVVMWGLFIAQFERKRRQRRRARAHDDRACPNCGYTLASVEEPLRCTECGEAWTREELREFWAA